MITLQSVNTSHKNYPFIEDLFLSAFPNTERRDIFEQRTYIDENDRMQCLLIKEEKNAMPIGFLTTWQFKKICYIEHFAVAPFTRNKGIGREALQTFLSQITTPVILEVECPVDPPTEKRIHFYENTGFQLWEKSYFQPPYPGKEGLLPMLLMAYGNINEEISFKTVKDLLYREIYHYPC